MWLLNYQAATFLAVVFTLILQGESQNSTLTMQAAASTQMVVTSLTTTTTLAPTTPVDNTTSTEVLLVEFLLVTRAEKGCHRRQTYDTTQQALT